MYIRIIQIRKTIFFICVNKQDKEFRNLQFYVWTFDKDFSMTLECSECIVDEKLFIYFSVILERKYLQLYLHKEIGRQSTEMERRLE